jgi:hypothetical protein
MSTQCQSNADLMSIKSQTIPFWRKSVANAMPIQSRFMSIKRQSDVPGPLILQARQACLGAQSFWGGTFDLKQANVVIMFFLANTLVFDSIVPHLNIEGAHLRILPNIWLKCAPQTFWFVPPQTFWLKCAPQNRTKLIDY